MAPLDARGVPKREASHKCADAESMLVRAALEAKDWEVLPRHPAGADDDWKEHIRESIARCDVFVTFETPGFGEITGSVFCTNDEFNQAERAHRASRVCGAGAGAVRPAILRINMLSRGEEIADVSTRVGLGNLGRIYEKWEWRVAAPTTIPAGLIDSINAVVSAP